MAPTAWLTSFVYRRRRREQVKAQGPPVGEKVAHELRSERGQGSYWAQREAKLNSALESTTNHHMLLAPQCILSGSHFEL